LKKIIQDYGFLFGISGFLVLLDQWSKEMVRQNLAFQETWVPWPWLLPYARIVHWKNTGAAFGMLQNFGDIFMILAIIVALFILYYFPKVPRQDRLIRLAMAIQFGGAIGNLIDRLSQRYVTDFIMLGSFPVFNG
jgi:signal peptidase II